MKKENKNLFLNIWLITCAVFLIIIFFQKRKIKLQKRNFDKVINDAEKGQNRKDTVIHKVDSIVNVVYVDSIAYIDGAKSIVAENERLKRLILNDYENEKYSDINRWLADSLLYYNVFTGSGQEIR